jgi:hypothetical protein
LIGKFVEAEICENPAFTVADGLIGLIGLSQVPKRNSMVRKLLIVKSRGQASVPGLHTFRITDDGLHIPTRAPLGCWTAAPPRARPSASHREKMPKSTKSWAAASYSATLCW